MKLNHECVRDVLLHIEENLSYDYFIDFQNAQCKNYSTEDLVYTVDKLLEAGYISGKRAHYLGNKLPSIQVSALTWSGHQFLDNIRDDGVWKDTKKILSRFSSTSIAFVSSVASEVIASIIRSQLHL